MKAVVLAIVVLICVDLVGYRAHYLHVIGEKIAGAGHEVGSWVYQP